MVECTHRQMERWKLHTDGQRGWCQDKPMVPRAEATHGRKEEMVARHTKGGKYAQTDGLAEWTHRRTDQWADNPMAKGQNAHTDGWTSGEMIQCSKSTIHQSNVMKWQEDKTAQRDVGCHSAAETTRRWQCECGQKWEGRYAMGGSSCNVVVWRGRAEGIVVKKNEGELYFFFNLKIIIFRINFFLFLDTYIWSWNVCFF